MTLRHRVIAVALAALAIIAVLGAQLVLRYADTQRSLSEVVDALAPASTAVADLNEDINNMERRLRIYVSSDSTGMGLLYRGGRRVRPGQPGGADAPCSRAGSRTARWSGMWSPTSRHGWRQWAIP